MAFYAEAASKSFGSQRPNGNRKPAYPRHPAPGKGPVNQSGKPKVSVTVVTSKFPVIFKVLVHVTDSIRRATRSNVKTTPARTAESE